jgi:hypothetical protein
MTPGRHNTPALGPIPGPGAPRGGRGSVTRLEARPCASGADGGDDEAVRPGSPGCEFVAWAGGRPCRPPGRIPRSAPLGNRHALLVRPVTDRVILLRSVDAPAPELQVRAPTGGPVP